MFSENKNKKKKRMKWKDFTHFIYDHKLILKSLSP